MIEHATAANARLRGVYPKGFTLDENHHPHITMLQQFVRTDALDDVYEAANAVLAKEHPTAWTLKAIKTIICPLRRLASRASSSSGPMACIGCKTSSSRLSRPMSRRRGTPAAFFSEEDGRDIQEGLVGYVADFVQVAAGAKFNPHVRPASPRKMT